LLNIDIARAFDFIAWSFLIEILQHLGFNRRWLDWIAALLSMGSTQILLNGNPSDKIAHARGLRQGDPLSPMLFLFIMEVLAALIREADDWALLQPLGTCSILHHASFYADGMALFLTPMTQDLQLMKGMLSLFEGGI
jgi:hypothetical protein